MEPLLFLFDTNALSYIADHPEYDEVILKLTSRRQRLIPHLTFINFFEYLKLVKDDQSLKQAQKYVKKLKRITLGGHIFPVAKLHVQAAVGVVGQDRLLSDVRELLTAMNVFLKLDTFAAFMGVFLPNLGADKNRIREIVEGYQDSNDLVLGVLRQARAQKAVDSFKRWLSLNAQDEYVRAFVSGAVKRFGITLDQFGNDVKCLLEASPSIRYFASVYLHYVRQQTLNDRLPRPSDYLDLEQVVYLNVADYFVTRDGFLRDLVNGCGEEDLEGRAITPEEFVRMLQTETIVRRAPQAGSSLAV